MPTPVSRGISPKERQSDLLTQSPINVRRRSGDENDEKFECYCLSLLLSLNCLAATTALNVPSEPSDASITAAIKLLYQAKNSESRTRKSVYLKEARDLLDYSTRPLVFQAAVYVTGNQQFIEENDGEDDFWESDEEWIESARTGRAEVLLLIKDGPNETQWTVSIKACRR